MNYKKAGRVTGNAIFLALFLAASAAQADVITAAGAGAPGDVERSQNTNDAQAKPRGMNNLKQLPLPIHGETKPAGAAVTSKKEPSKPKRGTGLLLPAVQK